MGSDGLDQDLHSKPGACHTALDCELAQQKACRSQANQRASKLALYIQKQQQQPGASGSSA
jgi:hypothetical protein